MREILFRGKRTDNGEWVEGHNIIIVQDGRAFIIPTNTKMDSYREEDGTLFMATFYCKVIPETVGQYTGLTDKKGKKIFEGDIVAWNDDHGEDGIFVIEYSNQYHAYVQRFIKYGYSDFIVWVPNENVILGNIHDNPELLEVHNG